MNKGSDIYDRLRKLFTTNGWVEESDLVATLETPLMRLCGYYLFIEKRRKYALDSVGKEVLYSHIQKFIILPSNTNAV